jgi:UDP-2,3-diacylglucosamine pyrophosphatase LpxH
VEEESNMAIIVVSDQHLGYVNSDKTAFNQFLDSLVGDKSITDLVLLGDVVDMWRRDASGVFLENADMLEKITTLMRSMAVHYIAGNHDFHVLQLQDHSYPFNFVRDLRLTDGVAKYRFAHGYEFDLLQTEALMEALCRVMSDGAGDFETGVWATITRDWSDLQYFVSSFFTGKKGRIRKQSEILQQGPEVRLQNGLGAVEQLACSSVQAGEILVFGHTHRPFINIKENVVNSGTWVKDAPVHNTFVRLENGKPRLFVFGGQEILARDQC